MRKQFVLTVEDLLDTNEKTVLLLGDIGVFGFRKSFAKYPERVYNIGILEQATISMAAGMAMANMIPIVHTIAPFIVERAYEQLKVDFCYQELGGNFVSVGASYDYAALGCTHHCPGDVGILKYLPGMEIVVPGTAKEFDTLFRQAYANGKPTYYRISERSNSDDQEVAFGKALIIKKGSQATIVVVGPALEETLKAVGDKDVTILYFTSLYPFDSETLKKNCPSGKILLCEPYYEGVLLNDIIQAMYPERLLIKSQSIPRAFLNNYGEPAEHDHSIGHTQENIRNQLKKLIQDGQ